MREEGILLKIKKFFFSNIFCFFFNFILKNNLNVKIIQNEQKKLFFFENFF